MGAPNYEDDYQSEDYIIQEPKSLYDHMKWATSPKGADTGPLQYYNKHFYDDSGDTIIDLDRKKGGRQIKAIDHKGGQVWFTDEKMKYYFYPSMPEKQLETLRKAKAGDYVDAGSLFNMVYDFRSFDPDTVDWSPHENKYQWEEAEILESLLKEK